MIKGSLTPNPVKHPKTTPSQPRMRNWMWEGEEDLESGMGYMPGHSYGHGRYGRNSSYTPTTDDYDEILPKIMEFNNKTLPELGFYVGAQVKKNESGASNMDKGVILFFSYDPIAGFRKYSKEFATIYAEMTTPNGHKYTANYGANDLIVIEPEDKTNGLEGTAC